MFNEMYEVVSFIVVNLFLVSHEKVSFGLIEIVVGVNSVLWLALIILEAFGWVHLVV